MTYVLAIDQGTTSSRAILFDTDIKPRAVSQQEYPQHYPRSGWVEHDPLDIWNTTLETCRAAMADAAAGAEDIAAIGITNQRETVVVWNKHTGQPIHNAIVWQDRRTADICDDLRSRGYELLITEKTGLLLDPYFSATKIKWILDNTPGAREAADQGELLCGTIDTWLIWNLTGGRVHATDATNACRTMLYDIYKGNWSVTITDLLEIPRTMLPEVRDSAADFGETLPELLGSPVKICGVAGDQQAATLGQACFSPGMIKSTYGTGCFALLNTGDRPVRSKHRLLTTIAYQLDGKPTYALEGSIFIAGAVIQWLRDGLGIIQSAPESNELAAQADPGQDVILVPAFTGLGAPYWKPSARGAVFGLSRNSGPAEFARAALQSVGYQTRDLMEAMHADWTNQGEEAVLRVDGGMSASDYAMQFLADIIGAQVDRPEILETTAVGAAWLAGMHCGIYPDMDEFASRWALQKRFEPAMPAKERDSRYSRWKRAVEAAMLV
ncbi:MAG: glycerol kinase [Oceanospirillaceae bacterium]|nr:glycerol kinase [Oceanospirillaceae bacterium]|tara:strand:+ start:28683 stop:30170 length:1488 start_codon:yes stop_codon:yes gene_type:complete